LDVGIRLQLAAPVVAKDEVHIVERKVFVRTVLYSEQVSGLTGPIRHYKRLIADLEEPSCTIFGFLLGPKGQTDERDTQERIAQLSDHRTGIYSPGYEKSRVWPRGLSVLCHYTLGEERRKSRFLTPFKRRTGFGMTNCCSSGLLERQLVRDADSMAGWTEMGVADTLIVYASVLYGG
jgi:hypothetical protein